MKRRLSAMVIFLVVLCLLLIVCYTKTSDDGPFMPGDISSAESASLASSATGESSFASSGGGSSLPGETSSGTTSVDMPSGGFSPWRGGDEPDLGGLKLPSIPEEGFSFLTRSLTLWLGESAAVGYEFKPVGATNRALTWSSSDETVVRVENGRLTAVGLGKATVRAETSGGRSAECRVTVVAEGTLSPLGALASTLADGKFEGLQFAKYDAELNGTAELFVRRIGNDGIPTVTVYRENGEPVLTVSTGADEEWAIWRRTAGGRYLLLSYSRPTAAGGTRYVLEEITVSDGKPVRKGIFARETAPDGTTAYYQSSGGELTPCTEATYQSKRKTYFSNNRQLPDTVLVWVTGQTAEEVDGALRDQKLPGQ